MSRGRAIITRSFIYNDRLRTSRPEARYRYRNPCLYVENTILRLIQGVARNGAVANTPIVLALRQDIVCNVEGDALARLRWRIAHNNSWIADLGVESLDKNAWDHFINFYFFDSFFDRLITDKGIDYVLEGDLYFITLRIGYYR